MNRYPDSELDVAAVAGRVGCSSRGACAIVRHLRATRPGLASSRLRVAEDELATWLRQVAGMRPLRRMRRGLDAVYFVRCGKAVKIGTTRDVPKRLAQIQKSNPAPVELLGVFAGGTALEAYFHGRYREARIHGEWFAFGEIGLSRLGLRVSA